MTGPRLIRFSDHAKQRWRQRIGRFHFDEAVKLLLESRVATKSERRNRGTDRKATEHDKRTCRVNEAAGVMFIIADEEIVVVKTVLRMS